MVVVEADQQAVGTVGGWHRESAPLTGTSGRLSNAILPAQRAFLIIWSRHRSQVPRWIQAECCSCWLGQGSNPARPPELCLVMAGGLPRGLPPVGAGGSGLRDNHTGWVSGHGDDDLAFGPAAFDVGEGLGGLVEPIGPVEDGSEDVGLDELGDLVELGTAGAHEQE